MKSRNEDAVSVWINHITWRRGGCVPVRTVLALWLPFAYAWAFAYPIPDGRAVRAETRTSLAGYVRSRCPEAWTSSERVGAWGTALQWGSLLLESTWRRKLCGGTRTATATSEGICNFHGGNCSSLSQVGTHAGSLATESPTRARGEEGGGG